MAECLSSVLNMQEMCRATIKVLSLNTASKSNITSLLKSCAVFCESCAKSCEVHAGHHAVCKACMESCKECAKACNNLA